MKKIETIWIDGEPVLVEFDETPYNTSDDKGTEQTGVDEVVRKAETVFSEAMTYARRVAKGTVTTIRQFDETITPDTFQIQFGVKFNGKVGVITEVGGEAHLVITLTYNHGTGRQVKNE